MSGKLLNKGYTVGIIAPASGCAKGGLDDAIAYFESMGVRTRISKLCYKDDYIFAGSDVQRALDVMECFEDQDVNAIFCSRGGYGSMRLLDLLDYKKIRNNPKPFFGISDITALHSGLLRKSGLTTYFGFDLAFKGRPNPVLEKSFKKIISQEPQVVKNVKVSNFKQPLNGQVVGGCLSLIAALMGTGYEPDFRGKVLILEDAKERPYRIDRMLSHLLLAGVFDKVKAVAFGSFHRCDPLPNMKDEGSVDEVLEDLVHKLDCPVVRNVPFGHHEERIIIPIGGMAEINRSEIIFKDVVKEK